MSLRHEPGVFHAAWFTDRNEPWAGLCSIGPSGFARYARLFHDDAEADTGELGDVEGHLDQEILERLALVLARHTATPDDCFFGLWDGFGELGGSPSVEFLFAGREAGDGNTIPPAFPTQVLRGPRVVIPSRQYLLFRGPLRQAGQWGAADLAPGRPRPINSPNLMWPADREWFAATEIDLPWTGIAGSAGLIHDLLGESSLDVEEVQNRGSLPYWRQ